MKMTIAEGLKKPPPGSFAINKTRIEWVACRDRFFKLLKPNMGGFYFSHKPEKLSNVIAFIQRTEKILDVEPSEFHATNKSHATWIEPSFWMDCHIKRSLLTLLIRAGFNYNLLFGDYEETLFSEPYLNKTRLAVMRFLFGFTKYNAAGYPKGWYDSFHQKEYGRPAKGLSYVKHVLVSPKESELSGYALGMGSLWR